jgi:DNA-directed RNA polymerase alpha subunit
MPTETKASLLSPTPELPDDILIDQLELPTRIGRALQTQGLKTVGGVRETSDEVLNSFPDLGQASIKFLRDVLGLPSEEGVRCGRSA